MPELPEVETVKNGLKKAIGLATINKVVINNNRFRIPIPKDFAKTVSGTRIIGYKRIAKYILIELDNNYSILWHLGMSGKVKTFDKMPASFEKHDHVVIETSKGTMVYNDARRFGMITYIKTGEQFADIGIDPFDKNLNGKYLKDKLVPKKIPIKVALLDQKIVNGIGNIYASEALFDAGISPLRESCSLSLKECDRLVESVIKILQKAIDAGGSTLRDYKKPDGSMGYFQNLHCVYGKTGQRCPHCTCCLEKTTGILKIVQAGRSTFYCATKQK